MEVAVSLTITHTYISSYIVMFFFWGVLVGYEFCFLNRSLQNEVLQCHSSFFGNHFGLKMNNADMCSHFNVKLPTTNRPVSSGVDAIPVASGPQAWLPISL